MTDIFIRKWLQMGQFHVWGFRKGSSKKTGYSWEQYKTMPSSGSYKDPYGNKLQDGDLYLHPRKNSLAEIPLAWPLEQSGIPLWEIFGKLELKNDLLLNFANKYGALSSSEYGPYFPTKPSFDLKQESDAILVVTEGVDTLSFWKEQVLNFGALLKIESLLTNNDVHGLRKLIKTPVKGETFLEAYGGTDFSFQGGYGTSSLHTSHQAVQPLLVYERTNFSIKRPLGVEFDAQLTGLKPTIPDSAQIKPAQLVKNDYDPIALGISFRNYLISDGLRLFPVEVGLCLENPEKPYPVLKPSCLLSALYFGYSLHIAGDLKYERCANCNQMGLVEKMTHRKDGTLLHKNETAAVHQRESRARKKALQIASGEPIRPRGRPKNNMIQ